ncbi:MAG: hypothetical protein GF398_21480 [Chitinivibrionales bacterium]|nr:hypothetical protein [Chitinivibrionales bacterium]
MMILIIRKRISNIVVLLALAACSHAGTVRRGRNEGTLSIPASNVMGNGNISAYAHLLTRIGVDGFGFDPAIGGQIGLGGILQMSGQIIPVGTDGLGPIEAHLQATLPGNDELRLFGIAARADLYLSTTIDTITQNADSTKPEFNPHLLPSLIVDLDWLRLVERFPLKTYFMASMADNPLLLHRYDQLHFCFGAEWKMYQHSLYGSIGTGLYKEKKNKFYPGGDDRYRQFYTYVEPGGRFRFLNRFSILGSVKVGLFKGVKQDYELKPDYLTISLKVVGPIYFKETNTEAIRTLIFMEQAKSKKKDDLEESIATQKHHFEDLGLGLSGIEQENETFDYKDEREKLVKQRREIQKKMDEIEQLLRKIEEEDEEQF